MFDCTIVGDPYRVMLTGGLSFTASQKSGLLDSKGSPTQFPFTLTSAVLSDSHIHVVGNTLLLALVITDLNRLNTILCFTIALQVISLQTHTFLHSTSTLPTFHSICSAEHTIRHQLSSSHSSQKVHLGTLQTQCAHCVLKLLHFSAYSRRWYQLTRSLSSSYPCLPFMLYSVVWPSNPSLARSFLSWRTIPPELPTNRLLSAWSTPARESW